MGKSINLRFIVLVSVTIVMGTWRLIYSSTPLPLLNFTPLGAMALFAGAYFSDWRKALMFPLLTLFVSDVVMMQVYYPEAASGLLYEGWYYVYGAFAAMVAIGRLVLRPVTMWRYAGAAVAAAVMHWLVTDVGVWLSGGCVPGTQTPFSPDIQGLMLCLKLALPYLYSMLMGNIVYGVILFGGFEWLQRRYTILRPAPVHTV